MTAAFVPQIALYRTWLAEQRGLTFASYEDMRQWSVRDLDAFWRSIWDDYDLQSPTPFAAVITERKMPGATWFPGAQVNYARQVFRHVDAADAAGLPALVSCGEDGRLRETSWPELRRRLSAQHPRDHQRMPGERQHRRGLERVRARHGRARRDRPLQADRAQGADCLRRSHLCRTPA